MGINAVQPTITGATPPASAVGTEVVDKARQTYQQLIATLDHPALWTSRMSGALVSELAKTPLLRGRAATLIVLDRQQNIFKAVDLRSGRELDAASVNLSKSQQLIIERSEQEADGCFRVIHNDRGYVKFDRHPQGGFGIRNDPRNPTFTTPASFPFLDSLALALFSHKKSRSAMAIATHREMLRQQLRAVIQEKIAAMGPGLTNDAHTPRIIAPHPKRPLTAPSLSAPGFNSVPVVQPLNNAHIAATLHDNTFWQSKNAEPMLPLLAQTEMVRSQDSVLVLLDRAGKKFHAWDSRTGQHADLKQAIQDKRHQITIERSGSGYRALRDTQVDKLLSTTHSQDDLAAHPLLSLPEAIATGLYPLNLTGNRMLSAKTTRLLQQQAYQLVAERQKEAGWRTENAQPLQLISSHKPVIDSDSLPQSKKRHGVKQMIPAAISYVVRTATQITQAVSAGIGSLFNRHHS